jgi:hypothetical protein
LTLASRNVVAEMADLARTPQAEQLTELHLSDPCDPVDDERELQPDALAQGPHLANLRRLSVACEEGTEVAPLLAGPYRASLLRLQLSGPVGLVGVTALADTPLPRLCTLMLNDIHNPEELKPLLRTRNLPNLATLILPQLDGACGTDVTDATLAAISKLATAPGLPHLSLVAAGWRHHWILGGGRAQPVAPGILPDWYDWGEEGPYRGW